MRAATMIVIGINFADRKRSFHFNAMLTAHSFVGLARREKGGIAFLLLFTMLIPRSHDA